MRSDAIGLFWQDVARGKGSRIMPEIPETGWQTPQEFPNLAAAPAIAIDVETKDPELKDRGPGWARGVGHIVGISVGVPSGETWYFPIRHEVESDWNLEPEHVLHWARDNLTDESQPKVGANITYDVGWLREEGVLVRGRLHDVQFAEALLRERARVNLDDLGERYLGEGKTSNVLYEWCDAYYGGGTNDQRANIYRAPPQLVGPYAEGDASLPFRVLHEQWPLLEQQGLTELYDMECRLIYLMVEMRYAGVRIDLDVVERMRDRMVEELETIDKQIKDIAGFVVNPDASSDMVKAFDRLGLQYGRTKKGNPSFAKAVLKKIDHPFVTLIKKKRAREKLKGTFLESYLLESHIDGFVYGQFHQLRGDSKGARSGRFSSSTPNLQNIPIRSEMGKLIRTAFVPDIGHEAWRKYDYSQIEYRGLAHYAVGPGAEDIRRQYQQDPTTDFHALVQDLIKKITGREMDRPLVKNVNFGTLYGMGERGLAKYINLNIATAKELFAAIHEAAPFLKETFEATMREADHLGYITTILGRRSRFDMWVPGHYVEDAKPLPLDDAILQYANPQRAYIHKALNRRLQGSAADLIKKAMLMCWEQGLFDEVGVPRLTVHDELDFSDPGGHDDTFKEIKRVMETAIQFKVPIMVDLEIGPSWGAVKENP